MSQITEAFLESLHLNSDKINREDHYQLTGGINKRITDNVGKLKEVMKAYDVTFDKTDSFFNIISKRVLNSEKINREDHYQLTGGTNKRITNNVGKLKEIMKAL